ncbi:protein ALTERED SEED GERMINATION 2-like [Andrographis paniculata]|uniref:protein ALTERED SEED GERMINATION 2-like n=1 Tax=Andrographis paniculata TaxID=175694 RepID=UPI0021E87CC1|nr:protein ALTERED SEED GERMINATION 2-like [Andrographis paniculata]XP_051143358.1 protein ALTERED SEED GERMINATION 2-like [Andrographis paniculata]
MDELRSNAENWLVELFRREMGLCAPRTFSRGVYASQSLIERIDLFGKLKGHQGCVNSIEFNSTGDTIVSGSDDLDIKLWDWATKKLKLSYMSGHQDNVFHAKIMPYTDDRIIVTASADSQVRLGQLLENGSVETKKLSEHQGQSHSLAVERGNPHIFYSCGEDGLVQHYDLRSCSATKLFYCSSLRGKTNSSSAIDTNSIDIDQRNPTYFALGGGDVYARIYDIRKCQLNGSAKKGSPVDTFCPHHLIRKTGSITAICFSSSSELLVSYSGELIYLFQKNMGLGMVPESEGSHKPDEPQEYLGHLNVKTVKGVNFLGPNSEYVVSGSDCGHVFIWEKKGGELIRLMRGDREIVNQVESHPLIPVVATSGLGKSIKLWSPSSSYVRSLPDNLDKILEVNRRGRVRSRAAVPSEAIINALRLYERQEQLGIVGERLNMEDVESDSDDEGEAFLLGLLGDGSEDRGSF